MGRADFTVSAHIFILDGIAIAAIFTEKVSQARNYLEIFIVFVTVSLNFPFPTIIIFIFPFSFLKNTS